MEQLTALGAGEGLPKIGELSCAGLDLSLSGENRLTYEPESCSANFKIADVKKIALGIERKVHVLPLYEW